MFPTTRNIFYVDIMDSLPDFAFLMGVLWNERAGRAMHKEDREFPEHIDLGGEA